MEWMRSFKQLPKHTDTQLCGFVDLVGVYYSWIAFPRDAQE